MYLNYKTKTMIRPIVAPSIEGKWLTGIDIGYSGCKVFAQNKVACFPCYARQVNGEIFSGIADENDIWYQDARTKEIWAVGETAVGMMSSQETNDNASSMYTRSRYSDPMFLVLLRTGLGIALIGNNFGSSTGKELFVESGLPAAYLSDEYALKDAFCQKHEFALKIGNSGWQKFAIELDEDHVAITSQPKGTLYSSITMDNGDFVEDGTAILKNRTLIFDAGFNTLDLVRNMNGVIDGNTTSYNDLGMKQVFIETAKEIEKKYREHIEIPYMQYILKTGIVEVYDRKAKATSDAPIEEILERNSKAVCMMAIEKIRSMYNDLRDLDYLIVTGGTGEAWWEYISEELKGMRSLKILPGNRNSELPFTFSNVRGYYYFLYRTQKKRGGGKS